MKEATPIEDPILEKRKALAERIKEKKSTKS